MKSTLLWALVALNALLLAGVVGRFVKPSSAMAQAARRPSDYIMIPGEIAGISGAVVFIIDTGNGQLGGMTYDDANKRIDAMPPIDLARVFEAGAGGVGAGGAGARPNGRR
jgi:hypothetical protein